MKFKHCFSSISVLNIFACLIAIVRTYNIILNSSFNGGQLCLVPDLSIGKDFSFLSLSIMFAAGLWYMAL